MGKRPAHGADTPIERIDIATIDTLRPLLQSRPVQLIGALGDIGDQPPLLAIAAATFGYGWVRGDPGLARTGARMIAAHLLATGIKQLGKDNVDRSRPRKLIDDGHYKMKPGRSKDPALRSFPSGHTAGAMAMAAAVAREYPGRSGAAFGAAATVGALQVPRRAHFPSDVIAGAAVGILAELIVDALHRATRRRSVTLP